jgi:glycosyltransferase involved in cell wall biosynthesis
MVGSKLMKLSVIVPVYNLSAYVAECLISVLEQQTDFDFEVIAVDDCSTDASYSIMEKIAQQYPQLVLLRNEENKGLAKTQKRLLETAQGDYIAYLDGDDVALPEKLQTQVDYLDAHSSCTLCFHEADMFDDESRSSIKLFTQGYYNYHYLRQVGDITDLIRYGCFVNASSIMFRRHDRMLEAIDEGCKIILDYPWHILNLSLNPGSLDFIPDVLGRYRVHHQSFGGQTRKSAERREQSLHDMLRACDNAAKFGADPLIIAQGRSHLFYSTALYFLRQDDVERFQTFIQQSVTEMALLSPDCFFDSRHKLAWENTHDPLMAKALLFSI